VLFESWLSPSGVALPCTSFSGQSVSASVQDMHACQNTRLQHGSDDSTNQHRDEKRVAAGARVSLGF
jgi:hypothetical protein